MSSVLFGKPSIGNCTVVALAAGATFTGSPEDVDNYASVSLLYVGIGNGCTIHIDMGTTAGTYQKTRSFTVPAGTVFSKHLTREASFVRVRLVNDLGAGLTPMLYTTLHACLQPATYAADGSLEVSSVSSVLPPNAATETTLSSRASEATVSTLGTEATLSTRASEATLATRASEATLASRASEATLALRASEATLTAASAKLPATLGPQAAAASLSVVPATGSSFAAGSIYRNLNLGTTGEVIKASAGGLRAISVSNLSLLNDTYFKLYDKATAATSADTPIITIRVLAGSSRAIELGGEITLVNGLGARASGAIADADNTAPAANTAVIEALSYT